MPGIEGVGVERRKMTLKTVIFSEEQEVTVPANIKVPEGTQYLLKPVLFLPQDKIVVSDGQGRVRIQGYLEGFLACVDDSEAVCNLPVPPIEFVAAFTTPILSGKVRYTADVKIEGIEVDQGETGNANITAYVMINLQGYQVEEVELVTGVAGDTAVQTDSVRIQQIIEEDYRRETVELSLAIEPDANLLSIDLCLANLSWQVEGGNLAVQGTILVKVYALAISGEITVYQDQQEIVLAMDFDEGKIQDGNLAWSLEKLNHSISPQDSILTLEVSLGFNAIGYREEILEYVSGIAEADNQFRTFHLRNRIGESEFKLPLAGDCFFPSPPKTIDLVLPQVRIIESQPLEGKTLVRGMLALSIFYTDSNDFKRVLTQEEEFNQFFDQEVSPSGYLVKTKSWVESAECIDDRYYATVVVRVEAEEEVLFTTITDVHIVDPTRVAKASVILYTTKSGDNLFTVARRFNTTQELLWEYNGLNDNQDLLVGQKLLIPLYKTKYESVEKVR